MITLLSSNPDRTVFTITAENCKDDFIGQFPALLLKEWAEKVLEVHGEEVVYLYSHRASVTSTARFLAASLEHGGEKQVCCAGVDNDDVDKEKMKC